MNETFGILYQIWLGFIAFLARTFFAFSIFHFEFKDGIDGIMSNLRWIGALVYSLWTFHRCYLLRTVMKESDFELAKRGLMSMYVFAVVHLILMIYVLINFGSRNVLVIVLRFALCDGIPISLNIWGARRVRSMLEEKEALELKLEVMNSVRGF